MQTLKLPADENRQYWLLNTVAYSTFFLLVCVTIKIAKRGLKKGQYNQRKWKIRKRIWFFLLIILIDAHLQLFDIDFPFDPYEKLNINRDSTIQEIESQYQLKANQRFSEHYPEEKIYYISTLDQAKQCVIEKTLNCELFGNSQRYYGYQMEFYTKIIILAYILLCIIRK